MREMSFNASVLVHRPQRFLRNPTNHKNLQENPSIRLLLIQVWVSGAAAVVDR